jgi:cysteine synthase A
LYRYDEAWELESTRALSQFADSLNEKGATLLDLRKPNDFATSHVPGAYNLPLRSLSASTPSPFSDASVLESQWKELEVTFTTDRVNAHDLVGKDVHVVCYSGDTARVATSVLRARGIAAYSLRGGHTTLLRQTPYLQMSENRAALQKQDWMNASRFPRSDMSADAARGNNGVTVGPL